MVTEADHTDATAADTGLGTDTGPGKKDSQLILRMNKAERDTFIALCQEMDSSAAREIRRFIRKFVKKNSKR
ncbi:hypothetical protein OO012_15950 [Rhodobacteraceae bacterium KMM 6894]|nr:hypothetical protein [Rhodobacteraceae bacterium KMM 6894]